GSCPLPFGVPPVALNASCGRCDTLANNEPFRRNASRFPLLMQNLRTRTPAETGAFSAEEEVRPRTERRRGRPGRGGFERPTGARRPAPRCGGTPAAAAADQSTTACITAV